MSRATEEQSAKLTAVIPWWQDSHNESLDRLELLKACIEALHRQDVVTPEIILVLNASTTEPPPLPGVQIVRIKKRVTVGEARNLGLQQVRTPFVIFCDADDLTADNSIPWLLAKLEEHPELIGVAGGNASIVEPRGIVTRYRHPQDWVYRISGSRWLLAAANAARCCVPIANTTVFRTDAFRLSGGFGASNRGEDWEAGVALLMLGHVLMVKDPITHIYRLWGETRLSRAPLPLSESLAMAARVRSRIRHDSNSLWWLRWATILPILWSVHLFYALQLSWKRRHQAKADRVQPEANPSSLDPKPAQH
ncbi:MAG: glycosyltransferase [Candidatus Dormibacteraceae bacterium]